MSNAEYLVHLEHSAIEYCNVIGQCLDSKSHRILSGYLESKPRRFEVQKNVGYMITTQQV